MGAFFYLFLHGYHIIFARLNHSSQGLDRFSTTFYMNSLRNIKIGKNALKLCEPYANIKKV